MKKHTTIIFLVIALVGCQSKLQVSDFVPAEMAVVNNFVTKSSAPKVVTVPKPGSNSVLKMRCEVYSGTTHICSAYFNLGVNPS